MKVSSNVFFHEFLVVATCTLDMFIYLLPSETTTASISSCSQLYTICAISPTSFAEKNIPRGRLYIQQEFDYTLFIWIEQINTNIFHKSALYFSNIYDCLLVQMRIMLASPSNCRCINDWGHCGKFVHNESK